jgi:hypothetical protein
MLFALKKVPWSGTRERRAVSRSFYAPGKGAHPMSAICHIPFGFAVSPIVSMTPHGLAVHA